MCTGIETLLLLGSTVIGGVGAVQQGKAAAASANYSAQVNEMNAKLADKAAKDALERGKTEEQKQRQKTAQIVGQQTASMAANGLDLSFGSPLDLLIDTATMGEIDALTIRSNAYKEERDLRQQGVNYRAQASLDRASGKNGNTAGYLDGFATVLGGGAKSYESHMKYKAGKG